MHIKTYMTTKAERRLLSFPLFLSRAKTIGDYNVIPTITMQLILQGVSKVRSDCKLYFAQSI